MAEKILKIKSSTLNVANLAMIFKLDPRQEIYIHSDEGENVLPDRQYGLIRQFPGYSSIRSLVGSEIYIPVNTEMKTGRCKTTEIKGRTLRTR